MVEQLKAGAARMAAQTVAQLTVQAVGVLVDEAAALQQAKGLTSPRS
jgi:hypothetical protein